jgi:hypothetical protein
MGTKPAKEEVFFFKKIIKIPIFYGNFVIIFSNDEAAIRKVTKYNGSLEEFAYTFTNFLCKGKESIAVVFNFWTEEPVTLGTIMHEVNHAGNRLMSSRNAEPSFENDEAESYIKGFFADEIQKFMKQCGIV